jgi:hypothetical protein
MFIEDSKEDKVAKQQYVDAHIVQTNTGKENVVEAEVRPSIEVQVMAKAQQRTTKIKRRESKAIT